MGPDPNYPSFGGSATPATTYGPAYANELGTRSAFGLVIDGNGSQFSISQLSFAAVGTGNAGTADGGDYNALKYLDYTKNNFNYGDGYTGILFGADRKLGGGDDTYITSGSSTQLVDGLIGRGSGVAYSATCGTTGADFGPCTGNTDDYQSYIDGAAQYYPYPKTFTGTYSLLGATGSASFNVSQAPGVPEAATWAMMILGMGAVGFAVRRRDGTTRVSYAA